MNSLPEDVRGVIDTLPTKSAKIRALDERGYKRADIARLLEIRYQHVRNVLEADRMKAARKKTVSGEPGTTSPIRLEIENGRLVLPPQILAAMALDEDGQVSAAVQDGELRVISLRTAFRRAASIAARHKKPGESVVDTFLAERKAMWNEDA